MSMATYSFSKPICFHLLALLTLVSSSFTLADPADDVAALVKAGNAKELAKVMASSVEMTLLGDENVYSKVQAEGILKDFFAKHPVTGVKLLHKINSNPNYRFTVLLLSTSNGNYRFSFGMKGADNTLLITEIRIEVNKD